MFMLPPCRPPPQTPSLAARNGVSLSQTYLESEKLLALGRREDAEHLAVLRHRAPSDLDSLLFFEHLDDGLIAEWVLLVLLVDDLLDGLLHALGRDVLVRHPSDRRIEEILELEKALRGVHVFVGGNARDGRFMHSHRFGDIAQDHRLQVGDALLEELTLLVDDALGDPDDRL